MRRLIAAVLVICLPLSVAAQDLSALKAPGAVALMRHALAPGTGDPAGFTLGDCATQRNLSEDGRAQARRIGVALREAGIVFDHVWTSQWCRCRETAELLELGTLAERPPLNSFFAGRGDPAAQTAATRALLDALPQGERAMLVTHYVNIRALTGVAPGSGEIVVVQRGEDGLRVADRILIAP
ncbi:histidine phosphatase family protein [Rhodosalinus sp. 5P4]|uniref:histidine phosphatase family protein n=1 Tax=Rhodosalinus sp. 5P4 TaxID=3239196 RepID=UPI003525CD13